MSKLHELEARGQELERLFDQGLVWLKDTSNLDRAKQHRLLDTQRKVRKVVKVLDKKPVFAIYGASQVGKSYLAHIILSGQCSELMVNLGEQQANFLEQINPPGGGAEATGVVTRFTIDPVQNPSFPVLVRFMSLEDISLVLCKAYYQNFSDNIPLDRPVIAERVEEIKAELTASSSPSQIDTREISYNLKDLENNLHKYFTLQRTHWDDVKSAGLWDLCNEELGNLLMQPSIFARLLSVLWMGNDGLTDLAQQLLEGLNQLNWHERGHLSAKAVLREEFGGAAIVDVATLKHIGNDEVSLQVQLSDHTATIERATLSALTKEIVLSVPPPDEAEQGGYLTRADIMDFPGARSPINRSGESEDISLPYLRGKVAHLFDQYSRDFEINNLLFCIPDQKNEVTDLPQILNEWIELNVGKTPEERLALIQDRSTSPLMVVFTWFNCQLEFDDKNDRTDTLDNKWEKRFKRFFEDEMVNEHEWGSAWIPDSTFKNIFPLRDYSFSTKTFSGYNEENKEVGMIPLDNNEAFSSAKDFHKALGESFKASEWCNKYLKDTTATWNSCAFPNKDGSEPIVAAMDEASRSSGLAIHAKGLLDRSKAQLIEELELHYHSDDISARHQQAERLSAGLKMKLSASVARNPNLILSLQKALLLSADKVTTWLDNQDTSRPAIDSSRREEFLMVHSFLNENLLPSECVEKFRSFYHLDNEEKAIELGWSEWGVDLRSLFSESSDQDESPIVRRALEHFSQLILTSNQEIHEELLQEGLDSDLLSGLLDQLRQGLETRDIAQRISSYISGQPDIIIMGKLDSKRLGFLLAHQWNEFVFHADEVYYKEDELEKIRFTSSTRPQDTNEIFNLLTNMFGEEPKASLPEVHFKPGLETVKGWLERLHNLFIVNCGFANYDLEANDQLGRLLEEIRMN